MTTIVAACTWFTAVVTTPVFPVKVMSFDAPADTLLSALAKVGQVLVISQVELPSVGVRDSFLAFAFSALKRSEERRVGKEC